MRGKVRPRGERLFERRLYTAPAQLLQGVKWVLWPLTLWGMHGDTCMAKCTAKGDLHSDCQRNFCLTAVINYLFISCLFTVPAPISIKFMTRGFVQAEIDKLKGQEKFTTKFTTEFERKKKAPPPPAKSTRSAKQSAPSTSASGKKPLIKKQSRQALLDLPGRCSWAHGQGSGNSKPLQYVWF